APAAAPEAWSAAMPAAVQETSGAELPVAARETSSAEAPAALQTSSAEDEAAAPETLDAGLPSAVPEASSADTPAADPAGSDSPRASPPAGCAGTLRHRGTLPTVITRETRPVITREHLLASSVHPWLRLAERPGNDAPAAPMTERMCAFCARDFPAV